MCNVAVPEGRISVVAPPEFMLVILLVPRRGEGAPRAGELPHHDQGAAAALGWLCVPPADLNWTDLKS